MPTMAELAVRLFVAVFVASWPTDHVGVIATVGAVSFAAIVVALGARCVRATTTLLLSAREKLAGIEPADVAVLRTQSDPDADGHSRPRAPGRAIAAA